MSQYKTGLKERLTEEGVTTLDTTCDSLYVHHVYTPGCVNGGQILYFSVDALL